jgi:hypothetical protein
MRAILWCNGTVTCVDPENRHVKEYQGMWAEAIPKLLRAHDGGLIEFTFEIRSGTEIVPIKADELRFLLQNGMRDEEVIGACNIVLQELRKVPNLSELPLGFTNAIEALRSLLRARGRLV